jgi:hypothetical protein
MDGDGSDGITQRRSLLAYRPSLAKQHIVASWQQEHDEASCIPVWSSTDYIYVGGAKKIRAARHVGRERMPLRRTTRLFADTRTRAIAVPSGNNLPDGLGSVSISRFNRRRSARRRHVSNRAQRAADIGQKGICGPGHVECPLVASNGRRLRQAEIENLRAPTVSGRCWPA